MVMDRMKVDSSLITSIGYDPENRILEIEFIENGEVKRYGNLDEVIYDHLISSTSIGQFYLQYIEGHYPELK